MGRTGTYKHRTPVGRRYWALRRRFPALSGRSFRLAMKDTRESIRARMDETMRERRPQPRSSRGRYVALGGWRLRRRIRPSAPNL